MNLVLAAAENPWAVVIMFVAVLAFLAFIFWVEK
jgi:cyanate permease